MTPDALAGLRDYHLPDALHWWPPAPGWWLLALLMLLALAAVWRLRRRRGRQHRAADLALRELAALRDRWAQDGDDLAFVRALAALLRRYALARWPADEAAGLSGAPWVRYLADKCAAAPAGVREALAGGLGRAITDLAYRPAADCDIAALAEQAEALIRHVDAAGAEAAAP